MIPKVIHQIWLGPKKCPADTKTWEDAHPSWTYQLWTERTLPKLQLQNLFDAFHGVYHAQADIARYELLYNFGGVYVDADSRCLKPLDDQFLAPGIWACAENDKGLIANGFIGASPEHPLLAAVIDDLKKVDVDAIQRESRERLYDIAWVLVGPAAFSEAIKETKPTDLRVYPANYFMPTHEGEKTVYSTHWWGSTKRLYED